MKKTLTLCGSAIVSLSSHAGLLAVDNPAEMTRSEIYLSAELQLANDMVPLKEVSGRWEHYSPSSGTNVALAMARVEAGGQVKWDESGVTRLAAIAREDWWASASRDTGDLIHQDRNRLGLDAGRTYGLDYLLDGFSARGVKGAWAKRFNVADDWSLAVGISGSWLHASKYRRDQVGGLASATTSKALTADVGRDFAYSDMDTSPPNFNPFVPPGSPSGQGYAVDLGFQLKAPGDVRFDLAFADALGEIRWKQMPRTRYRVNNANVTYNAAGDRSSVIAGVDSRESITERLHTKTDWKASLPLAPSSYPSLRGELGDSIYRGEHFLHAGLQVSDSNRWGEWRGGLDYDLRFKSLGLSLSQGYFSVALRSDALSFNRAKVFGLQAGFAYPF